MRTGTRRETEHKPTTHPTGRKRKRWREKHSMRTETKSLKGQCSCQWPFPEFSTLKSAMKLADHTADRRQTRVSEEHKAGWNGPWTAPHCWGVNLGDRNTEKTEAAPVTGAIPHRTTKTLTFNIQGTAHKQSTQSQTMPHTTQGSRPFSRGPH